MSEQLFRILLVEDNPGDVYLFRKGLEMADLNFTLTVIDDGADALAFVRCQHPYVNRPVPDLAVLDLNLPKSKGTEILEAIRQSEDLANLPVVITSSSESPRDQMTTKRLGVERYIRKPPDLDEFLDIGVVLKTILIEGQARKSSQAY